MFALSARLQFTPTRATAFVTRAKVFGFPALGYLLGLLVLILSLGCEKGSPIASEGMVLTLRVSPSAIFSHGDSTSITITATEADGRPAIDGLRIQLTATSGSLPAEARTVNGSATEVFISDSQPGDVTLTARAGAIGADGSVNTTIVVQDRNFPIGAVVLTVNPSNLNITGGVVQEGDKLALSPIPRGVGSVAVSAHAGDRQLKKTATITRTNQEVVKNELHRPLVDV